jgi:anti-anti-sigma factor
MQWNELMYVYGYSDRYGASDFAIPGPLKVISSCADSKPTTSRRPYMHSGSAKANKAHINGLRINEKQENTMIEVERSGEWMPADELRDKSLSLLGESENISLNLDKVEYLDASALQILLAIEIEQQKQGLHLHLVNTSQYLLRWFELAGAGEHFSLTGKNFDK